MSDTKFLTVPSTDGELDEIPPLDRSDDEDRTQKLHVLLVEDSPVILRLVGEELSLEGFSVSTASDGEEGIQALREAGRVDILVTDVHMPQVGGHELAREAAKLHPEAKILFMSGLTTEEMEDEAPAGPGIFFIEKPFTPSGLIWKIREILDPEAR